MMLISHVMIASSLLAFDAALPPLTYLALMLPCRCLQAMPPLAAGFRYSFSCYMFYDAALISPATPATYVEFYADALLAAAEACRRYVISISPSIRLRFR